jgi:MFS family permease
MVNRPPSRSSSALLALAYLAFISLGLPDAVLGVAWPSLRGSFGLSHALLGVLLAVTAIAYFISGMLAGRLMQGLGIGRLLAGSTALVAAAILGYSASPAFALIVLLAPLVGFGSGAIDAALNTYAARNFSPKHMSWLHAAYAAGAMAGPAIRWSASPSLPWWWPSSRRASSGRRGRPHRTW